MSWLEILWHVFQVYALVNLIILFTFSYKAWFHRSLPVWVLDRDGGLDFFLGRIALWPYFYTVMLIQYVRARKARAITVRRVDQ